MTNCEILLKQMRNFRAVLIEEATRDSSIETLLARATPLFDAIEAGEVLPPLEGQFVSPFQGEGTKYAFPHPLYSAASEFICALEDWPSKSWWPVPKEYGAEP